MSWLICCNQGRVVRKPLNANPGLKSSRSIKYFFYRNAFGSWAPGVVEIIQDRGANNVNRKLHCRVTKLKSKFWLILG